MFLVPVRSQGHWDSIYVTNSMEERRRDAGVIHQSRADR